MSHKVVATLADQPAQALKTTSRSITLHSPAQASRRRPC